MSNTIRPNVFISRGLRFIKTRLGVGRHFARLGPHRSAINDPEYDRIYHVHCRKTAGTSVNKMFLRLAAGDHPLTVDELYGDLAKPPFNVSCGQWRFSAWSAATLRHPQFDYGFSHIPLPRLRLPDRTFRFTVLRDPIDRACSLYDMLAGHRDTKSKLPDHQHQIDWVRGGFAGFVRDCPAHELAGQLSMFSTELSVDQAIERIAGVEMITAVDTLSTAVARIGARFALDLSLRHLRRASDKYRPQEHELAMLRERLDDEFRFFHAALSLPNAIAA